MNVQWAFIHPLACRYMPMKCPFSTRSKWHHPEFVGESKQDAHGAEAALCDSDDGFNAGVSHENFCRNLVKHFYEECTACINFKFHGTNTKLVAAEGDELWRFEGFFKDAREEAFRAWLSSSIYMPFDVPMPIRATSVHTDGKIQQFAALVDLYSFRIGGDRPPATLQEQFLAEMKARGAKYDWLAAVCPPKDYEMPVHRESAFWAPMYDHEADVEARDYHIPGGLGCSRRCSICHPPAPAPRASHAAQLPAAAAQAPEPMQVDSGRSNIPR